MCNLGEGIEEKGIAIGREKDREEGRIEGHKEQNVQEWSVSRADSLRHRQTAGRSGKNYCRKDIDTGIENLTDQLLDPLREISFFLNGSFCKLLVVSLNGVSYNVDMVSCD